MAEIPVLQPKEKINTQVAIPDVQGSTYLQPSVWATLGTQVAQSTAIQMATNRGYELGQTPQGELLPPITKTDEAFVKAYSAQAQTTLGLQAQKMMNQSQLELLKLNKLSPGDIATYEQNMTQGFQSILENAPSTIRPELANQFSQSLLNSTNQLNTKYIKQQKEDQLNQFKNYTQNTMESVYTNSVLGVDNKDSLKRFDDYIQANVEQGLITQIEADTLKKSINLTDMTGMYINGALEAKQTGELETYLSDLGNLKNKPDQVNLTDWMSITDNVYKYLQKVGRLEDANVSAKITRIENDIYSNTVDAQDLIDLQNDPQVTQAQFNRVMGMLNKRRNTQSAKDLRINALMNNTGDLEVFARSKEEDINAVYDQQLNAQLQKGASLKQAKVNLASQFAGPIPVLSKTLNLAFRQGDQNGMFEAAEIITAMTNRGEVSKLNLSNETIAGYVAFKNMQEATGNVDIASKAAYDTVYNKTNDQRVANNLQYKEYEKSHLNKPAQRKSLAKEILGFSTFPGLASDIQNEQTMINTAVKAFEQFYKWGNGNIENAKESAKIAMSRNYGETNYNGRRQFVFAPLEKIAGVGFDATPVIQRQALEQLAPQLEATKKAFDEGKANEYYRIKNPDDYNWEEKAADVRELYNKINETKGRKVAAGELIENFQNQDKLNRQYLKALKELNTMKKGKPIEVEMVQRNGKPITYRAEFVADSLLSFGTDVANPVVGPYVLTLVNEKNVPQPMLTSNAFNQQRIAFIPDISRIKSDYNLMSGQSFVPQLYTPEALKAVGVQKRKDEIPRSGVMSPAYRSGVGL